MSDALDRPPADVQQLTILGDRMAGKTKLLVDIAVDEAGRQGRQVLFFTPRSIEDSHTLKLIEARSRELIPELVEQVHWSNGRERIRYTNGGLVYFRHNPQPRQVLDTVIIDDVAGGDYFYGATRVYKALLR